MGFAYKYGEGVEQSDEEAVQWYRQAADQGHAAAQFSLAAAEAKPAENQEPH